MSTLNRRQWLTGLGAAAAGGQEAPQGRALRIKWAGWIADAPSTLQWSLRLKDNLSASAEEAAAALERLAEQLQSTHWRRLDESDDAFRARILSSGGDR